MSIEFQCPNCKAILSAKDGGAGMTGKCPKCQNAVEIPKTSELPGEDPEAPAAS